MAVGKGAHGKAVDGKGTDTGSGQEAKEVSSFHVKVEINRRLATCLNNKKEEIWGKRNRLK